MNQEQPTPAQESITFEFAKESIEEFMGIPLTLIESVALKKIARDTDILSKKNNESVATSPSKIVPFTEAQIIFLKNLYGIGPEEYDFLVKLSPEQRKEYFTREQEKLHTP